MTILLVHLLPVGATCLLTVHPFHHFKPQLSIHRRQNSDLVKYVTLTQAQAPSTIKMKLTSPKQKKIGIYRIIKCDRYWCQI
jgi:hypothetical protein